MVPCHKDMHACPMMGYMYIKRVSDVTVIYGGDMRCGDVALCKVN